MPILDKIKEVFTSDKSSSTSTHKPTGDPNRTPAPTSVIAPTSGLPTGPVPTGVINDHKSTDSSVVGTAFDAKKVKVIFVLGGPGAGSYPFHVGVQRE